MKITRISETIFSAETPSRNDYCMEIIGNELVSKEIRHHLRTTGLLRIALGPVSFEKITHLKVGESYRS